MLLRPFGVRLPSHPRKERSESDLFRSLRCNVYICSIYRDCENRMEINWQLALQPSKDDDNNKNPKYNNTTLKSIKN